MSLLQMNITAGMLILGIALFRTLFLHRLPKKVMVILWEITVLRLLIPFSLSVPVPASNVSVWNAGHIGTEGTMEKPTAEKEDKAALAEKEENMEDSFIRKSAARTGAMIKVIYVSGALIMAAGSVFIYIRDRRIFMEGLPMPEEERSRLSAAAKLTAREKKRFEKIRLQISDRTTTPVTYGIFRSAIVFPKEMGREQEAGFFIRHELVHIRNQDNLKKLIIHAVLCIHWFNPTVWIMYLFFNRDMELLCDETVLRNRKENRKDYALALLSLAEQKTSGFLTGMGFGKNAVRERIESIMKMNKVTFGGILAAVIIVVVSLASFVTAEEKTDLQSVDLQSDDLQSVSTIAAKTEDTEYASLEKEALEQEKIRINEQIKKKEEEIASIKREIEIRKAVEKQMDDLLEIEENLKKELEAPHGEINESVKKLVEKYKEYGLAAEYTDNDYQLYLRGQ